MPFDEPALAGLIRASHPCWSGATRLSRLLDDAPLAAIELAEVLATFDVPAGAVNILTGYRESWGPGWSSHMDVNAIDVTGADGLSADLERLAAYNVKRAAQAKPTARARGKIADFLEPGDGLAPDRALSSTAWAEEAARRPRVRCDVSHFARRPRPSTTTPDANERPCPRLAFGTRLLLPPMSANPESSTRAPREPRSSTRP